jgi:hypothetical protein
LLECIQNVILGDGHGFPLRLDDLEKLSIDTVLIFYSESETAVIRSGCRASLGTKG